MSDEHESALPVTEWLLDEVVEKPYENLPLWAEIPYAIVSAPVVGVAAVGGIRDR